MGYRRIPVGCDGQAFEERGKEKGNVPCYDCADQERGDALEQGRDEDASIVEEDG